MKISKSKAKGILEFAVSTLPEKKDEANKLLEAAILTAISSLNKSIQIEKAIDSFFEKISRGKE